MKLIKPKTANEWIIYNWVKNGHKGRVTKEMIAEINWKIKKSRKK